MIPSLNYAVLTDALHALKDGDIRHRELLGFTFDEMNALNQLSLDELFIVSRASAPFVSVSIRHEVLPYLLTQAHQEHQKQALLPLQSCKPHSQPSYLSRRLQQSPVYKRRFRDARLFAARPQHPLSPGNHAPNQNWSHANVAIFQRLVP